MLCQKNTRLRRFRTGGQGHAPILFFIVFASLICHAAGCLACGLTGSLAFAAAAGLGTLAKIAGLNGVDVLHIANPPNFMSLTVIIARPQRTVNELTEENSPKR